MKLPLPSIFVATLLLCGTAFAEDHNTLSEKEKKDGWTLLFDGKTTQGWVGISSSAFPEKGWSVIDGALVHQKSGGGGDIVTQKSFTNFELSFEWKIGEMGNSGVKYNLPNPAKNVGFEYQLLDDARHPDGVKNGASHQTGALYDLIEPSPSRKINAVGQWNQSRLLVDGKHVEHWINGASCVSFEIQSEDMQKRIASSKYRKVENFGIKTASPILLQDHGDEIQFRNLKIRELPSKP